MAAVLPYESRLRGALVGLAITVVAILISGFTILPAALFDPTVLDDPYNANRAALSAFLALNFVGLALGGLVYLGVTHRGREFVDLAIPDRRDLLWMVGGVLAVLGFYVIVGIAATVLDLPAADSDIVLLLGDDATMVLIMIVIVLFLNAPAEEFLFRNVVQKRLYDSYSGRGAVVVTSAIFASIHIQTYLTLADEPVATLVSLAVIFGGSLIMGYVYLRTENLLVPIVVHAGMNVFMLVLYLLNLLYDVEEAAATSGFLILT